jgi:hypothetical protein
VTQLQEPPGQSEQSPFRRRDERSNRGIVVVMLIIGLIFSGLTQSWATNWKVNHSPPGRTNEAGVLSGMNSYALALMLGGLRGPLVMVLWSKVETQKIDKDLEDMDTMIEWIRLLQPEFDTVHIFQIWNKAYNISVMMASTAQKYTVILDAVDYGRKVDQDRPGDLNVNDSLARVFAEKLGGKNVAEHVFYRKQFRQDTMTEEARKAAYPEENGKYRRMGLKFVDPNRMGPILDDQGNLLPQFTTPLYNRPSNLPPGSEWNDGAELQYIKDYGPFPYGISPIAMGYAYAKRAQVAMTVGGQRPLQISDTVVDSRPGLLLKQWAEEEAERAVNSESRAIGLNKEGEAHALEMATASAAPTAKIPDPRAMQSAVYSYRLTARVCGDALKEYERHLANPQYVNPYQTYTSHLEELRALQVLSTADAAYAQALVDPANRTTLLATAAANYREARAQYQRMLLRYATEESVAGPMYRNNRNIDLDKMSPEDLNSLFAQVMARVVQIPKNQREFDEPRDDYGAHITRCDTRLKLLGQTSERSILQVH